MLLTKIILNDLGVYRGRNEFDFKTTQEKPVILIGGTNGAGKTTLFESVMLCLYGQNSFDDKKTQKQYHEIILRSIHRYLGTKKSADQASIIIEFQFAHEGKIDEYQVMRMWQNNDGKVDETFTIKKKNSSDEKFEKLDSIAEDGWQIFIDQLIPSGIVKLFFFDGEKIQSIAEEAKEQKHIKLSFDVLLGLDLVNQLNNDIGLTMLRNSKGETKQILADIDAKTKQKEECDSKINYFEEKIIRLQTEINVKQNSAQEYEEELHKLGGHFVNKREQLTIEKTRLEAKLENIEKEIRELCTDVLPFSLIPAELEEVKNIINLDKKQIQTKFEKAILEEKFQELQSEINSKSFLANISSDVKNELITELSQLLKNKIETASSDTKTTYNLSTNDMEHISQLIDKINNTSEEKIESLAKSYNLLYNSLEKTKVGLDSAPKEDEIGPIFSKLASVNRELGEIENEKGNLENLLSQEKSLIVLLNAKIRSYLSQKIEDKRRISGLEIGSKVQEVLEKYATLLRSEKLELLEEEILTGLQILLHKKDFIEKISIDKETFEVKLYKGNDDEITKDMLSKGELQMYATAIVWGLAKTSGRPLPFMIDTPLARLDEDHRMSLIENFYPERHQTIILSTDSEINSKYYKELEPYISRSFVIQYDSDKGSTVTHQRYFFDEKGEKIVEV